MKPLSALEMELIRNGFKLSFRINQLSIYAKGEERMLYDTEKRDLIIYNKNEDLYEYINKWRNLNEKNIQRTFEGI